MQHNHSDNHWQYRDQTGDSPNATPNSQFASADTEVDYVMVNRTGTHSRNPSGATDEITTTSANPVAVADEASSATTDIDAGSNEATEEYATER